MELQRCRQEHAPAHETECAPPQIQASFLVEDCPEAR